MASDRSLFDRGREPALRLATRDLSWLLSRGYPEKAALKLVGDRHELGRRQRRAVSGAACTDDQRRERQSKQLPPGELQARSVAVDGFNCLITVETALRGGTVLRGRDGCHRDLAGVHGTYRAVRGTGEAIRHVGRTLAECEAAGALWYLDRPVSSSGRLKALLEEAAAAAGWRWTVELHRDPDRALASSELVVATSDHWILDRCAAWTDLVGEVLRRRLPDARVLDLG
jgi:hypothetical protein